MSPVGTDGHGRSVRQCPLSDAKRKSQFATIRSAFDPTADIGTINFAVAKQIDTLSPQALTPTFACWHPPEFQ
jgi:hypothetical protein